MVRQARASFFLVRKELESTNAAYIYIRCGIAGHVEKGRGRCTTGWSREREDACALRRGRRKEGKGLDLVMESE